MPAKGLSLRRGRTGPALLGRMLSACHLGSGTAPGFGDVWIELCTPSNGSLPGRLGLEE